VEALVGVETDQERGGVVAEETDVAQVEVEGDARGGAGVDVGGSALPLFLVTSWRFCGDNDTP